MYPRFLPAGDSALVVEFGSDISPETNAWVTRLDNALSATSPPGVVEVVPTYRSLMLVYDPLATDFSELCREVEGISVRCNVDNAANRQRWIVPTAYGGATGEDLAFLAKHAGISELEVIRLHSSVEYRVYMIGFAPGFTYLGGLPQILHTPRRAVPKARVEAGSVMIGGMQTAIASVATPTGWYVLGRTPARAFDGSRTGKEFLFRPGDTVRFEPVPEDDFAELEARAATGDLIAYLEAQ
jgi:KipI family sensor histidine kinase inhibitor